MDCRDELEPRSRIDSLNIEASPPTFPPCLSDSGSSSLDEGTGVLAGGTTMGLNNGVEYGASMERSCRCCPVGMKCFFATPQGARFLAHLIHTCCERLPCLMAIPSGYRMFACSSWRLLHVYH